MERDVQIILNLVLVDDMIIERRRSPRFHMALPVYFASLERWGVTRDLSLEGCFVEVEQVPGEGFVEDLLIDIPVVGAIALKGYVHHTGNESEGLGMQFVQVRFEPSQSGYYEIYSRFVRTLSKLQQLRADYLDMVSRGELQLQMMPPYTVEFHTTEGEGSPETVGEAEETHG